MIGEGEGREGKIPFFLRDIVGAAAFAGIIYMAATIDGYSSFLYKGGHGLTSLLTVFVIYAMINENSIVNKILSCYPLTWIGVRSYGIYLWHYPIILLVSSGKKSTWWMILVDILLTGILSALSYYFIETPIRRGAIRRNVEIMKSKPETPWEKKKRGRTIQRNIKVICGTAYFS